MHKLVWEKVAGKSWSFFKVLATLKPNDFRADLF